MKVCRACNKESSDYPIVGGYELKMCRTCYNAQRRASYAANADNHRAKSVARYQTNFNGTKDKHHERSAKKYAKQGASVREWYASLPVEKQREIGRRKQAKYREKLTDCYVRRLITTETMQVSNALIQAKKLQIQIERFCNAN